jgi:hypothetical protein
MTTNSEPARQIDAMLEEQARRVKVAALVDALRNTDVSIEALRHADDAWWAELAAAVGIRKPSERTQRAVIDHMVGVRYEQEHGPADPFDGLSA